MSWDEEKQDQILWPDLLINDFLICLDSWILFKQIALLKKRKTFFRSKNNLCTKRFVEDMVIFIYLSSSLYT